MFSASVLNNIVGMLGNMIITRILTKPEYGLWSYVLNIYSYMVLITGFGLLTGAFQFAAENRGKEEEFQYYKYCFKTGIIIDTILIFVFLIITFLANFSMSRADAYLRVVAPMLLIEYALNILLTVLRCENRIKEYAKILNINTLLLMAGTCMGAFWGVGGVILGKYIAYSFSLLQAVWRTKSEVKRICCAKKLSWQKTKSLWHYSIFTGTSSALNCLMYLLDVSMVAAMIRNPETVAVYKVATLIPNALTFIPTSVITCVLPNIVLNNKNYPWLRTNIKKIFCGLGMFHFELCGGCSLFAPLLISILSGTQYLSAVSIFRVLILSYFVSGTFRSMSVNTLTALRCVNYGLFISISSAVCNIIFNYIFIQKYGAMGAAYATLGVATVAAILSFGYMNYKLIKGDCRKDNHISV